MVQYFELDSLCRLIHNPKDGGGRMNCFMCNETGIKKYTIRVMDKDVMLCEHHNRIFGDGIESAFNFRQGNGPVLQDM